MAAANLLRQQQRLLLLLLRWCQVTAVRVIPIIKLQRFVIAAVRLPEVVIVMILLLTTTSNVLHTFRVTTAIILRDMFAEGAALQLPELDVLLVAVLVHAFCASFLLPLSPPFVPSPAPPPAAPAPHALDPPSSQTASR